MQEVFEQITQHVRAIWRYRWYAMLAAWLVFLVGWVIVLRIPVTYTASAKIYVDTYTVLKPLLQGLAVEKDPSVYVGLMARQLVSRPNLEEVARVIESKYSAKSSQEFESLLSSLEWNVQVDATRVNESAKQRDFNFYTISYSNVDPTLAKQVVEALIDSFVKTTVDASLRDSERAKAFLEQQIETQREILTAAETRISDYKREHIDKLPEQKTFFQRLQSTQAAVADIDLTIAEAEHRRSELQRQLASTSPIQRAISRSGTPIPTPLESKLSELQTQLDELVLNYTEKHPAVIETRFKIAQIEKELETEQSPVMTNPVYQQLEVTINQIDSEIAALSFRREEFRRRVQSLQGQTEILTKVEADLQRLNQDYENAKQKYDTLVARQGSAAISGSVEQAGEDLRFKVMDPPWVSGGTQNIHMRLMQSSGVLAASLGGGIGLAFLLAQLWPAIYGPRALNELAGFQVIGTISRAPTFRRQMKKAFELAAFVLVSMMILGIHGVAVFLELNKPGSIIQILGG